MPLLLYQVSIEVLSPTFLLQVNVAWHEKPN